jgi:hypothetical protein
MATSTEDTATSSETVPEIVCVELIVAPADGLVMATTGAEVSPGALP